MALMLIAYPIRQLAQSNQKRSSCEYNERLKEKLINTRQRSKFTNAITSQDDSRLERNQRARALIDGQRRFFRTQTAQDCGHLHRMRLNNVAYQSINDLLTQGNSPKLVSPTFPLERLSISSLFVPHFLAAGRCDGF